MKYPDMLCALYKKGRCCVKVSLSTRKMAPTRSKALHCAQMHEGGPAGRSAHVEVDEGPMMEQQLSASQRRERELRTALRDCEEQLRRMTQARDRALSDPPAAREISTLRAQLRERDELLRALRRATKELESGLSGTRKRAAMDRSRVAEDRVTAEGLAQEQVEAIEKRLREAFEEKARQGRVSDEVVCSPAGMWDLLR